MYSPQENKEKIIARLEELKEDTSFEATKWSEEVIDTLVDMASRGKMIRGSLLIDAYDAMSGEEDVVEYAAAIELVHTGLLIHDDIIDRDEVRRGEEALHVSYRSEELSDREARNLAMCAGDIAYFLAFKIISDSNIQSSEALSVFSSTFARVGLGEMSDIELSAEGGKEDIIQMYRDKTASYTFAMPLRLAALLVDGEDRPDLKNLGLKLGVLYQIKDDHLDLFSETEDTGKPDASDIVEGKTTLHTELLKERSGTEINGEVSEEEAQRLVSEMRDNGVDRAVEHEMAERKKDIEERIEVLDPELGGLLKQVVELVIERKR